ncbi:tetratricopeptide repeat protein [Patescibacteria group bacterium]
MTDKNKIASNNDAKGNEISHFNAVQAALSHNWKKAIKINNALLKSDKDNIGILNRLGFAYLNIGKSLEAKKMFQKVKKLDPYNQIADKNLRKLESSKNTKFTELENDCNDEISPLLFIEEPGVTKIVTCINTAPKQIIASIRCGQDVFMKVKNHVVEIRDIQNRYLAALPDDLSFRLNKLISAKNKYHVLIKNVDKKTITIFIREISRGKKFINQPSFISTQLTGSYTRVSSIKSKKVIVDKPDTRPTGEK